MASLFFFLFDFDSLADSDIPLAQQPSFVLSVETDELSINAGLQDRVVQCYEGLVAMDFERGTSFTFPFHISYTTGVFCFSFPPLYTCLRLSFALLAVQLVPRDFTKRGRIGVGEKKSEDVYLLLTFLSTCFSVFLLPPLKCIRSRRARGVRDLHPPRRNSPPPALCSVSSRPE